jgi:methoxymalonate biosynthesis acyl carrier protein
MAEDPRPRIRAFIARFFPGEVRDDEDLLALGFVNSLWVMELVMFVEQGFGITVDDADLEYDNFRSIDAIARLVERKTSQ